uniref:PEPxxWA-CTERM sorting domain-containing protein n=1 Tax=uncultured Sphingomonas sp. TaxID=158754 RepID=UPI0035C96ECF
MNVAKALKPSMIFAAGTFATGAHAATTVDTTGYSSSFSGSNITLAGASTPQYSFVKNASSPLSADYVLNGLDGATVTATSQTNPFFPSSTSGMVSSVVTGVKSSTPSSADQYYGLAFQANNVDYTGYAKLNGAGDYIDEIDYKTMVASVPEPETWALMIAGFGGMGLAMRRRRHQGIRAAIA